MQLLKILTIIILPFCANQFAQTVYSFGSAGAEYGKASCTDRDTNYICAALFSQTINVSPAGTYNLVSHGGIDVAIVKLNNRGDLIFGKRFGGATTTDAPHAAGTDSAGNIYIAGYFGIGGNPTPQSADFNPNGGGTLTTRSGFDAYLAKYDKNGNYLWALGLGNTAANTEERCWDLAVDPAGNVYLSGAFHGSVDFNPLGTPNIKTLPDAGTGLFLSKYNSQGINQWVVPIAANDTSVFYEAYTTVDLDKNNNVILAGNFRGSNVNFNPAGTAALSSTGQTDIFFASYSVNGSFNFVKRVGGTLQDIVSPGAMRIDRSGNIFFTGRISGTVDFDPGTGVTNVTGASMFLASYTNAGDIRFAFGMASAPGDGGHRVGFDSEQSVYVSGWMNGTVNFNPSGSANLTANSSTADVFLAKYSNTGAYVWAHNFGAADATDQNISAGLTVDLNDNIIITGQFSGSNADFDPGAGSILLSSRGGNDCFIAKYNKFGEVWRATTAITEKEISGNKLFLFANYPNPAKGSTTFKFFLPENERAVLTIYNILGHQMEARNISDSEAGVHELRLDTHNYAQGIYFCMLQQGAEREIIKFSVVK